MPVVAAYESGALEVNADLYTNQPTVTSTDSMDCVEKQNCQVERGTKTKHVTQERIHQRFDNFPPAAKD